MHDSTSISDCIIEFSKVLDESIELLKNLEQDAQSTGQEKLVQVSSVVELVDMSYELAHSVRVKNAEIEFLKRHATRL